MMFRRTFFVLSSFLIINIYALWAGDSASFADLGFSPDGAIFTFAQYGVKSSELRPWAEMFIVDVARNTFVSGGKIAYTHDRSIDAGQDGVGALYHVIARNAELVKRHNVEHLNQGLPLYIALEGDPAYEGKTITFRDFISGISYRANVVERLSGNGANLQSQFYIKLTSVDSDGSTKNFTIGTPGLERPSILSYRIKKVLIAPSGDSLIFVIEMKRHAESGPDIRYMVEALRF